MAYSGEPFFFGGVPVPLLATSVGIATDISQITKGIVLVLTLEESQDGGKTWTPSGSITADSTCDITKPSGGGLGLLAPNANQLYQVRGSLAVQGGSLISSAVLNIYG